MIEIKVTGSVVSVQETEALYCGAQQAYTCHFTFDRSWDRFTKTAVFRVDSKAIAALVDETDCCALPWELLTNGNIGKEVEVGLYGVSGDNAILTSVWDSIGAVREGTELGSDAREPSRGIYQQVMASVKRVDDKVTDCSAGIHTLTQRAESAAAVASDSAERAMSGAAAVDSAVQAAESALQGVQAALADLPEGSTLVINDLTTGGKSAALSAEMGKTLNESKLSNAGGTMKGPLIIDVNAGSTMMAFGFNKGSHMRNTIDSKNYQELRIDSDHFYYTGQKAGVQFGWDVLHAGNKPKGSYSGNADATTREIKTGGIGSFIMINSGYGFAIVGTRGAVLITGSAVSSLGSGYAFFSGGVLKLNTDNNLLNAAGQTYYYQEI